MHADDEYITPASVLTSRQVCTPCKDNEVDLVYVSNAATSPQTWKRVCIKVCPVGQALVPNATNGKFGCSAANCKRAPGGACQLPKCTAKQDLFKGQCVPKCTATQKRNPTTGKCELAAKKCPTTQELVKDKCVAKCKTGMVRNALGTCVCPATQELVKSRCVAKCRAGTVRNASGVCVPTSASQKCLGTQELFKGKCVPKCARGKKRNAAGRCV